VLCDELPGEEAPSNKVMDAAIQALGRHGLITRRFFDELLDERPYRRDEIERVATIYTATAEYREHPMAKQVTLAPSEPLKFASISIDVRDPNWCEIAEGEREGSFDRPCSQRFKCGVYDADPLFDVTLLNVGNSPTILTAIGIQVLTICPMDEIRSMPKAAKIFKSDSYVLEIPDIARQVFDRFDYKYEPQHLQETIVKRLPDPIYLQPNAPYRYEILLKDYSKNIPQWAKIRMWGATDQGPSWSGELELEMRSRRF
jgi:hypothetical protein